MKGLFGPTFGERVIAFIIRWVILAIAVWVAAELIEGIHLDGWESTLIIALILGLLNVFIKPFLVYVSLPVTILTLGLFLIVINTALLGFTAWLAGKFDDIHFAIDDFGDAFLGAIIISLITFVLSQFINAERFARDLTRRVRL